MSLFILPQFACIPSLCSLFLNRLKEELEKHGLQILAQAQSVQDEGDNSQRMVHPGAEGKEDSGIPQSVDCGKEHSYCRRHS